MNEFSPKPDLWSKIQRRKDFDLQVNAHVANLPERMPKADLWSAIGSELDRKNPVIPLWKYGMAAASTALILALSGLAYLEFGEKDVETPLITEVEVETPDLNKTDINPLIEVDPASMNLELIEVEKPNTTTSQLKETTRITPAPIAAPALDLPDLTIENTLISEIIIPIVPEQEAPQTLHKVQISWGFQDKKKLRTSFGSGALEDITERQIGRVDETSNSIKINFKKQ
ncbi:hypothetical protein [Algoriphagus aquimarinus]|uniref:Uncharacterized protein n=1 Tax=Algoriphagus aquimarinus TaxID=237018 RepID=A0A1I1C3W9_9BACT|nr:hypothetical protein [Algoriphagus aquimarinus]SFB57339.1 hypothetical protein SAMN04489723_12227 [Algoriphagus aquimarinus]